MSLAGLPGISDIRAYGLLGGVDIDPVVVGRDGYGLQKSLYDHGVHVKTTGNSLILAPPFVLTHDQIDTLIATIVECIAHP